MQPDLADLSAQALAAHAVVDSFFDDLDRKQMEAAMHELRVQEQRGEAYLSINLTKLLEPVRRLNFRHRMKAHDELAELIDTTIAAHELASAGADVVRH